MASTDRATIVVQGVEFDAELIEALLDSDGFFSGVVWEDERTWIPDLYGGDRGGYRTDGQMGELQRRGLARESNRGWYGTRTLRIAIEGAVVCG